MHFVQYYLDCLSQASYLIADESTRKAVVVDPRRDIEEYLADAKEHQLDIVGIVLTHFHADFVSGHLELAKATYAWIGMGKAAEPEFEFRALNDGERISLGDVTLQIITTPGHTPESISVQVFEHADDEVAYGVLTGDALFIGDVGRPDLLTSVGISQGELAAKLYDSVQHKLMGLPDDVRVFPAHGAGSACGKNLSTEKSSTIGMQRRTNYACKPMPEQKFIDLVTEGQPSAPAYFAFNASFNKQDRAIREPETMVKELSESEVLTAINEGALILDTRDPMEFASGHLRGSVNGGVEGRMAETAGAVIGPHQPFIIVADPGQGQQTALRMARIGFDNAVGVVSDPYEFLVRHPKHSERSSRLTPSQMVDAVRDGGVQVIDIRNAGELVSGRVDGSMHIPLAELPGRVGELAADEPVILYCAGGYRSSVAASLLRTRGFADVSDVLGGYDAIGSDPAPTPA